MISNVHYIFLSFLIRRHTWWWVLCEICLRRLCMSFIFLKSRWPVAMEEIRANQCEGCTEISTLSPSKAKLRSGRCIIILFDIFLLINTFTTPSTQISWWACNAKYHCTKGYVWKRMCLHTYDNQTVKPCNTFTGVEWCYNIFKRCVFVTVKSLPKNLGQTSSWTSWRLVEQTELHSRC